MAKRSDPWIVFGSLEPTHPLLRSAPVADVAVATQALVDDWRELLTSYRNGQLWARELHYTAEVIGTIRDDAIIYIAKPSPDARIDIRLRKSEKAAFEAACRWKGDNMTTVLLDAIRKYVADKL